MALPKPARLRFRDGTSLTLVDRDGWKRTNVGRKLMKRCEPAPFGAGQETRRDERVRKGGQLRAERGAFRVEGLDVAVSRIIAAIGRSLCPGDNPSAELYALNVYPRGGHFVSHKDTPRDGDVFGTLVACFPIPFRGGRLLLRHDTSRSFDWEVHEHFGLQPERYEVQWAAFYGDVDHAIEPVTDGTRVTVTWLLRTRGGTTERKKPNGETRLDRALARALEDTSFMTRGGTLGVPCLHLYPHGIDSALVAPKLKGRDRLVAFAAERAGLEARYRPYLFETCADESWRLSRHPTTKEAAIFRGSQLEEYDLEEAMPIERRTNSNEPDDVEWIVPPPWERGEGDPFLDADPAKDLLGDLEYSATGYFGNEAGDAAFYVSAAILIDVPRARARRRVRGSAGA